MATEHRSGVAVRARVLALRHGRVARAAPRRRRKLRTLEEVVAWLGASGGALVEVVTQDEYTHDVVVAAGAGFLVFDTT